MPLLLSSLEFHGTLLSARPYRLFKSVRVKRDGRTTNQEVKRASHCPRQRVVMTSGRGLCLIDHPCSLSHKPTNCENIAKGTEIGHGAAYLLLHAR
jgi:hypothetical protein